MCVCVCVCLCIIGIIARENLRIIFHHLLNTILNSSISTIKLSNATFINQTLITNKATILIIIIRRRRIKFITSVLRRPMIADCMILLALWRTVSMPLYGTASILLIR